MTQTPPLSRLIAFANKWSLIAALLVALAREVSLARKMRAQCGAAKAHDLEAALFAALVSLSDDLAELAKDGPPCTKQDQNALIYLQTLHALLLAMVLVFRHIGQDLQMRSDRLAALGGPWRALEWPLCAGPARVPIYLDSS